MFVVDWRRRQLRLVLCNSAQVWNWPRTGSAVLQLHRDAKVVMMDQVHGGTENGACGPSKMDGEKEASRT